MRWPWSKKPIDEAYELDLHQQMLDEELEFDTKVMNKIFDKIIETGEPMYGEFMSVLGEPVEAHNGKVDPVDILIEGGNVVANSIAEHGEGSREVEIALQEWSNAYRFLQRSGQMA